MKTIKPDRHNQAAWSMQCLCCTAAAWAPRGQAQEGQDEREWLRSLGSHYSRGFGSMFTYNTIVYMGLRPKRGEESNVLHPKNWSNKLRSFRKNGWTLGLAMDDLFTVTKVSSGWKDSTFIILKNIYPAIWSQSWSQFNLFHFATLLIRRKRGVLSNTGDK